MKKQSDKLIIGADDHIRLPYSEMTIFQCRKAAEMIVGIVLVLIVLEALTLLGVAVFFTVGRLVAKWAGLY
jgi:hypothetical protein